MKGFKTLVFTAVILLTLGLIGTADAFHAGGVAECVGCHSMHERQLYPGYLFNLESERVRKAFILRKFIREQNFLPG